MNSRRTSKIRRVLVISLSTCSLFLFVLYWILSCTLLSPAFYSIVLDSKAVTASLENVSEKISIDGTMNFSEQFLKDNALSLAEGILRFIKDNDMSLSNIAIEEENAQSIRSAVMATNPEVSEKLQNISRIHPYVLSYFFPGSENIYPWLYIVQKGFSTVRSVSPVLLLAALLLLLIPEKTAENIRQTLMATGIGVIVTALLIWILRQPLLLSPLSGIMPAAADFINPFVHKTVSFLFLVAVGFGVSFNLVAQAVTITPVRKFTNRYSRNIAAMLVIFTGIFLVLYNSEIFDDAIYTMKTHVNQQQVNILQQGEGTVHSLTIKLREEGTDEPVTNVKLILSRLDNEEESLWMTINSDVDGNARFILPEGQFLLYAEPSSVPRDLVSFAPVTLLLDRPDSSWYTLHFSKGEAANIKWKIPGVEILKLPNRPQPLLK